MEYNFICPKCNYTEYLKAENDYEIVLICKKCCHCVTITQKQIRPALICPRCNSTAVTTGARGVNGFWGAIGASKTVNRCGNCGHMWEPRR